MHALPRLFLLLLALLPGFAAAGPAADGGPAAVTALPQADAAPLRLPPIRLHGNALQGDARSLSVDELDRVALLVTWKILDPYKRTGSRYTGILLKDLVSALAPKATHVRMRAVNDYVTEFGRAEWERLPILLATRDGDARMPVANKGPARIIFRQDADNEMAMQVHAPKWIWQVIDVEFQSR